MIALDIQKLSTIYLAYEFLVLSLISKNGILKKKKQKI